MAKKAKVVKAKVVKAKRAKRMTKRYQSWEVWSVFNGKPSYDEAFSTLKLAEKYVEATPKLLAPVIIPIDIPPLPY